VIGICRTHIKKVMALLSKQRAVKRWKYLRGGYDALALFILHFGRSSEPAMGLV
jgi:hypothetical protein